MAFGASTAIEAQGSPWSTAGDVFDPDNGFEEVFGTPTAIEAHGSSSTDLPAATAPPGFSSSFGAGDIDFLGFARDELAAAMTQNARYLFQKKWKDWKKVSRCKMPDFDDGIVRIFKFFEINDVAVK